MNGRQVLVIDLVGQLTDILCADLHNHGYEVTTLRAADRLREVMAERDWAAIILNLDLHCIENLRVAVSLIGSHPRLYLLNVSHAAEFQGPIRQAGKGAGPADETLDSVLQNVLLYHRLTHISHTLDYPWETMFEAAPDMIAILDLHLRVIRCNRHFSELFRKEPGELSGVDLRELFGKVGEACGCAFDGAAPAEHVQFELHDEALHKDFQMTLASLHHEDGGRWGYVLFAQDMTERKLIQKQLLHSQKMESVGTLAAGVAHEINNPVGFIHSNLNSLRRYSVKFQDYVEQLQTFVEMAPMLQPEEIALESQRLKELKAKSKIAFLLEDVRQLVDESQDGTERIRRIVNNLKGFARNDDTRASAANLNERMDGVLNLTWNELKYKATVTKEYGELPPIQCFAADLDQVFVNLLINAVQAIPEKGEIVIRTWQEGEMACVSVRDTGTGIPSDILPHIFEPFYTTKPVGKGTGLGLSISYDIVNKHGGEIKVASRRGEGTTFTVMLPFKPPSVHAQSQQIAV